MKYAFVYSSHAITKAGGVRVQAMMWKDGLERLGHEVSLVTNWDGCDWKSFDVLLVFGFSQGIRHFYADLAMENPNLVLAPIIDPRTPPFVYKFICKWWGSYRFLRLSSRFHDLWLIRKVPILWLIRSEQERYYVSHCLEVPQSKIAKIPLHYRIPPMVNVPEKEKFCLHVSRLASPNKNVARLIEAAKKYGFNLKLTGHLKGDAERQWLKDLIGDAKNIEYLGLVSDSELCNLYAKAKVFALPSLQEGVGMVALEAAAYGCEIVLTNIGAPKEYYDGMAVLVNPKSVDEIGKGVMKALNEGYAQPKLKKYVEEHFSERACMELLNQSIENIIKKDEL